eukprot:scaffold5365_cov169-Ochromonas_danica.AAC.2
MANWLKIDRPYINSDCLRVKGLLPTNQLHERAPPGVQLSSPTINDKELSCKDFEDIVGKLTI